VKKKLEDPLSRVVKEFFGPFAEETKRQTVYANPVKDKEDQPHAARVEGLATK